MTKENNNTSRLPEIVQKNEKPLLEDWIKEQLSAIAQRPDLISEAHLRRESAEFLKVFLTAILSENLMNIETKEWQNVRDLLSRISESRAEAGFNPSETATFIFSLKQPLFARLRKELTEVKELGDEIWRATVILDKLGLYTTEVYLKNRESVIQRQQEEIMELATPVVKLWDGILAVPLIGILDSARTQQVMESLLNKIVDTGSDVAIIDITGVPTVDTLVANHLIKTVSAARLMGAECIISGISPQIAQTMVTLGVTFEVITKASLAEALAKGFEMIGITASRSRS